MRFAYADPPYLGCAVRLYGDHPESAVYDTEMGHRALIAELVSEYPDGWALSMSSTNLWDLLPLCPSDVRVMAWVKPFAEYVKHRWAGAWVNSLFRNESKWLSSLLIREAIAITRSVWTPPPLGIITFVDASKVRRKRDPGRCYLKAGFRNVGHTVGGLVALQMLPEDMPEPLALLDTA